MVELKKMLGGKTQKKAHGGMCGACHPKKKSTKPKKKGGLNDLFLTAFLVGANTYFKKSNKNKTKNNKSKRKRRK